MNFIEEWDEANDDLTPRGEQGKRVNTCKKCHEWSKSRFRLK